MRNKRPYLWVCSQEKDIFMALKIVWSNPSSSPQEISAVRRIMKSEYGALYLVSYSDGNEEFELTTGRVNRKQQSVEQPQSA
jgi:hypothetical protein